MWSYIGGCLAILAVGYAIYATLTWFIAAAVSFRRNGK